MTIRKIEVWQASDDTLHRNASLAQQHEEMLKARKDLDILCDELIGPIQSSEIPGVKQVLIEHAAAFSSILSKFP